MAKSQGTSATSVEVFGPDILGQKGTAYILWVMCVIGLTDMLHVCMLCVSNVSGCEGRESFTSYNSLGFSNQGFT